MSERHPDSAHDTALERFARRAFEDDVAAIDADTRTRLAAARRHAVAAAARRRFDLRLVGFAPAPAWIAAGAAAVLVVALAAVLRFAPAGGDAPLVAGENAPIEPIASPDALESPVVLELLAGGEPDVLDVLEEDLAFYAWLEQQPEFVAAGQRP